VLLGRDMTILLCSQYLGLRPAILEASVDRQEQAPACSILAVALVCSKPCWY